jgi:hypothetical protein
VRKNGRVVGCGHRGKDVAHSFAALDRLSGVYGTDSAARPRVRQSYLYSSVILRRDAPHRSRVQFVLMTDSGGVQKSLFPPDSLCYASRDGHTATTAGP